MLITAISAWAPLNSYFFLTPCIANDCDIYLVLKLVYGSKQLLRLNFIELIDEQNFNSQISPRVKIKDPNRALVV